MFPYTTLFRSEVPRAVERHGERVVEERLAVDAVASAEVLLRPDQRRRASHREAVVQLVVEIEPQRPPREILTLQDALLSELAPAQREACPRVAARDADLVIDLLALPQHQILPIRRAPRLDRRQLDRQEDLGIAGIAGRDADVAMVVPGRAVRVALELRVLLAVHHLDAGSFPLHADIAVVREGGRSRAALFCG